jgi:hypothetical protein
MVKTKDPWGKVHIYGPRRRKSQTGTWDMQ